jgi:hypothetical protein
MTKVAPPLLNLLAEIRAAFEHAKAQGLEPTKDVALRAMRASDQAAAIEALLNSAVKTVTLRHAEDATSLVRVVNSLASGCFILIAFLNARRKDELEHRKIGLHRHALRLVDEKLGLYECEFYIEKTYKDYLTYYVGGTTQLAIQALEKLSDLARDFDRIRGLAPQVESLDRREEKLFQLPRIVGKRDKGGGQWYAFVTSSRGAARDLIERALGKGSTLVIAPHMFRRAYALLFHYRYEHATLQALAQQLGHLDLGSALTYVTDSPDGPLQTATAASYARRPATPDEARTRESQEIQEEINAVGQERVHELAREVVDGTFKSSGGFVRLMRRFHQNISRSVEYQVMSGVDKAKTLADAFVHQGHAFKPMRHANCVASPARRGAAAKCFSKRLGRPAHENANAPTCSSCAYSHFVQNHLTMWKQDADELDAEAQRCGERTVAGSSARVQSINLRTTIKLVEVRMSKELAPCAA